MTKDPVCGMTVEEKHALSVEYGGERHYFCSQACRDLFEQQPAVYAEALRRADNRAPELERTIAYFSMEIALESDLPTYSGGLGALAGDTLRSCADMRVPVVGVTLLHRHGYLRQELDAFGNQKEFPNIWRPDDSLTLLAGVAHVAIEGRSVELRAWQYDIQGVSGFKIAVLLLDADIEGNAAQDRELTNNLYGGDQRYRLAQEVVLGIGGTRMLRELGYTNIRRFHQNEGHAGLLALELLMDVGHASDALWDFEAVKDRCVFTTHTPVPAGHDQFDYELVQRVLGDYAPFYLTHMLGGPDALNMTYLALNLSRYINGVAKRHGEVSREMFPHYPIDSITNGVHSYTWTTDPFRDLYDRYIPGWRSDSFSLRYALAIPKEEIWHAHATAKRQLIELVNQFAESPMDETVFTVGFARRATQYKRTTLVLTDLERLRRISKDAGTLQFVFAGKAHPNDLAGKDLIRQVFAASRQLDSEVKIAYLPNYDMQMARTLAAGVDLWLNTPRKPMEASGTSGMKAAHNGVPSLSVLDGWWREGHIEGVTGWSIGTDSPDSGDDAAEAEDLYDKLESTILPLYYNTRDHWHDVMRHTIAFNASFFNTHRMVLQYVLNAYSYDRKIELGAPA